MPSQVNARPLRSAAPITTPPPSGMIEVSKVREPDAVTLVSGPSMPPFAVKSQVTGEACDARGAASATIATSDRILFFIVLSFHFPYRSSNQRGAVRVSKCDGRHVPT